MHIKAKVYIIILIGATVLSTHVFGEGTGPVFLGEVQCIGNEASLLECRHAGIGNHVCGQKVSSGMIMSEHQFDVAILCSGNNPLPFLFTFLPPLFSPLHVYMPCLPLHTYCSILLSNDQPLYIWPSLLFNKYI